MDFPYQTYSRAALCAAQEFVTIFLTARGLINKREFIGRCHCDTLIVDTRRLAAATSQGINSQLTENSLRLA